MAVWLSRDLQTSAYWQEVQSLCNELLDQSPTLKEWTIRIRPKTDADAEAIAADQEHETQDLWYAQADFSGRELTIGVPEADAETEETEPEDAATYLVFDILDPIAKPDDEAVADWLTEPSNGCRRALDELYDADGLDSPRERWRLG